MKKAPNIIIIMTDDQGYGDLSCMGASDFKTPHLDHLAQQGARFNCMYSNSPVCSPSRAALLTGRYPGYAGVRSVLAGHRRASGLTSDTPTIATALKRNNYHTGLVGKWHLGLLEECRPNANGFDEFYGFLAGCVDYYSHIFYWSMADGRTNPTHDLWHNEHEIYENGEYLTDLITRKSIEFIRKSAKDPFMLFVSYNAPHYPLHAPQKYLERFPHLSNDRRIMAAMISAVDDGVGQIMAELTRQGLTEDTLIYFQSDNGPSRESRNWMDGREDPYCGGSTGMFTGHKFSLFEGGIRVPAILCWPGHIPSAQVINDPAVAMDIFPTIMDAIGGDKNLYQLDGKSLLPRLMHGENCMHRRIFWEMGQQTAVRQGQYKLILNGQLEEFLPSRASVFLADIINDPGEQQNLASKMPELTEELKTAALEWRLHLEDNWKQKFAERYVSLT